MGFFMLDQSGAILEYKSAREGDILEDEERLRGQMLRDHLPEGIRDKINEILSDVRMSDCLRSSKLSVVLNGNTLHLETFALQFPNHEMVLVIKDITGIENLRERLRLLERDRTLILNSLTEMIYFVDLDFRVIWANRTLYEHFNLSSDTLEGFKCFEQVLRRKRPCRFCSVIQTLKDGKPHEGKEFSSFNRKWILRSYPVFDNNVLIGCLGVGIDVTELKNMESALRISEQNYRTVVESIPTGICVDFQGEIVYSNKKLVEYFGYSENELNTMNIADLVHPDDRYLLENLGDGINCDDTSELELRGLKKDGSIMWFMMRNASIVYKDKHAVLRSFTDVTKHKDMENALSESRDCLRHLSSQIIASGEKERNRISKELHDELGQALSLLKLDIGWLMKKIRPSHGELIKECEKMRNTIDDIISNVRRLARDLSPVILDDLGLSAALGELINSLTKHYSVAFTINCEEIDNIFTQDTEIILYRIFQESLNNVIKHANASHISISIYRQDGNVFFDVIDNGIGFDMNENSRCETKLGIGLATMAERVKMLGGQYE
ncbi:MAG: PAS domain S-box protein, partial [Syntrophales bacterium]